MYEAYIKQVVRSLDSHSMEFAYVSTVKKRGEKLFEHYLDLKDNVRFIDSAKSHEAFDDLALAIYSYLSIKSS